jgi:hypothetical protein
MYFKGKANRKLKSEKKQCLDGQLAVFLALLTLQLKTCNIGALWGSFCWSWNYSSFPGLK